MTTNGAPVAIVTGAGSGIGRAVCVTLSELGWRLVLVGRREARLVETRRELGRNSDDVLIRRGDVADPGECRQTVEIALASFDRLDAIVNNAALAPSDPIDEFDRETFRDAFDVNVGGPFAFVAAALPHFRRAGAGCVVNVSSMATLDPFPGLGLYAATKSAVESLGRSIVNEAGADGMRAYAVAPGAVETAMLRSIVSEDDLPRENTLAPSDVARVIVDCVLGRIDEPNGAVIRVPSP